MCHAVALSQGGCVEINIEHFGTDSLLTYIADRFSLYPYPTCTQIFIVLTKFIKLYVYISGIDFISKTVMLISRSNSSQD